MTPDELTGPPTKFNSSIACGAIDEFLATKVLSQAD
jgi:hypothetical protein